MVRTALPSPARPASARRGFFFTVLALVLLSFIFVSLQLWAQAQTQEETRAAERFRVEALTTALGIVGNETVTRYANASALYALQTLATAIENHPDCAMQGMQYYAGPNGEYPDGTYYLNASVYELMKDGTTSGYLQASTGPYQDSSGRFFYTTATGSPASRNLTYSGDSNKYAFSTFFNRTRAAVRLLGYEVQWGPLENFTLNQTGPWNMTLTFWVQMNFSDPRGQVNVSQRIPVNITIPVDGLTDPSVLRSDMLHRGSNSSCTQDCSTNSIEIDQRPHRNIYRGVMPRTGELVYDDAQDAQAKLKKDGLEGLGWFFGPVSSLPRSSFSEDNVKYNLTRIQTYIFYTQSADEARAQAGYFGGIILDHPYTQDQTTYTQGVCQYTNYTQTNCLFCLFHQTSNDSANCPTVADRVTPESIPVANPHIAYLQTDGDPTSGVPLNYHLQLPELLIANDVNSTQFCGLTFNSTDLRCDAGTSPLGLNSKFSARSHSKAWDLTGPRDMALCGFYVRSDYAPSYSQRFTYFWPHLIDQDHYSELGQGIESFVVGQWAGGASDQCAQETNSDIERYSRLDYHFYTQDQIGKVCAGPFVQGLPGCRSPADCSSTGPLVNATGRFATSNPGLLDPARDLYPSREARYNTTNITISPNVNPISSVCK